MSQMIGGSSKTKKIAPKDTLESLRDNSGSFLDQFFGQNNSPDYGDLESFGYNRETKPKQNKKQEFKLFNYQEYYENTLIIE
jgi:hypothetical protein